MKKTIARRLAHRKRRLQRRLDKTKLDGCSKPVFTASNLHYDLADRTQAIAHGGSGAVPALARQLGLVDAIDERLHLLKFHLPFHESAHVLNFACNALCDGACLQDLELRRNDAGFRNALGARRIPDPTTAGDFCRRLDSEHVQLLQDIFDDGRLRVWATQPASCFGQEIIDLDGTLGSTEGECKQGMDIAYKGTWGYHPLVLTLANTKEVLRLVHRSGNRPSHEGAAPEVNRCLAVCFRGGFAASCCEAPPTSPKPNTWMAGTPMHASASSSATTPCPTWWAWRGSRPVAGTSLATAGTPRPFSGADRPAAPGRTACRKPS